MSELSKQIRSTVKQSSLVSATVVDVLGSRASVRLSNTGAIVRNLVVGGGPVVVNQIVHVSYATDPPTIVAPGLQPVQGRVEPSSLMQRPITQEIATGIILVYPWGKEVGYPVTSEGLTDAISDAVNGSTIKIPQADLIGDFICPVQVRFLGLGQDVTILRGVFTFSATCSAWGISFINHLTDPSTGISVAIKSPQWSASLSLESCTVSAINCISKVAGGDAYGIVTYGGDMTIKTSLVSGEAFPGDAWAVDDRNGGTVRITDTGVFGSTAKYLNGDNVLENNAWDKPEEDPCNAVDPIQFTRRNALGYSDGDGAAGLNGAVTFDSYTLRTGLLSYYDPYLTDELYIYFIKAGNSVLTMIDNNTGVAFDFTIPGHGFKRLCLVSSGMVYYIVDKLTDDGWIFGVMDMIDNDDTVINNTKWDDPEESIGHWPGNLAVVRIGIKDYIVVETFEYRKSGYEGDEVCTIHINTYDIEEETFLTEQTYNFRSGGLDASWYESFYNICVSKVVFAFRVLVDGWMGGEGGLEEANEALFLGTYDVSSNTLDIETNLPWGHRLYYNYYGDQYSTDDSYNDIIVVDRVTMKAFVQGYYSEGTENTPVYRYDIVTGSIINDYWYVTDDYFSLVQGHTRAFGQLNTDKDVYLMAEKHEVRPGATGYYLRYVDEEAGQIFMTNGDTLYSYPIAGGSGVTIDLNGIDIYKLIFVPSGLVYIARNYPSAGTYTIFLLRPHVTDPD